MTSFQPRLLVRHVVLLTALLAPASVATATEVLLPDAWAGRWELTIVYSDRATASIAAVDHITDVLFPREPFGLALFAEPVSCAGTATDTRLTVQCTSRVSEGLCTIDGEFQLTLDRDGDTVAGGGAWQATVTGICGLAVSRGETIEVSGGRTGPPGTVARPFGVMQKFVTRPVAQVMAVRRFAAFTVDKLDLGRRQFEMKGSFALGSSSDGIAPVTETVRLQVGSFTATLPAGSFRSKTPHPHQDKPLEFKFEGAIEGAWLEMKITALADGRFAFKAEGQRVELGPPTDTIPVALTIGGDGGTAAVTVKRDDD
jgi:hypothetical protein